MTRNRRSAPPPGLGTAGRRLWKQVQKQYTLRPDEAVLLETACKTVDVIAELEAAMDGQPLTTTGSMGQQREHPLLSEARQQRGLLNRTLAQLKLPDMDAGASLNQQRAAGLSRWAQAHGGHTKER